MLNNANEPHWLVQSQYDVSRIDSKIDLLLSECSNISNCPSRSLPVIHFGCWFGVAQEISGLDSKFDLLLSECSSISNCPSRSLPDIHFGCCWLLLKKPTNKKYAYLFCMKTNYTISICSVHSFSFFLLTEVNM